MFDPTGVVLPVQQAWTTPQPVTACQLALQKWCQWERGRCVGCSACMARHEDDLRAAGCTTGAMRSWSLDVFGLGNMECVK